MENIILPLATVNYHLVSKLQLTIAVRAAVSSATFKCSVC